MTTTQIPSRCCHSTLPVQGMSPPLHLVFLLYRQRTWDLGVSAVGAILIRHVPCWLRRGVRVGSATPPNLCMTWCVVPLLHVALPPPRPPRPPPRRPPPPPPSSPSFRHFLTILAAMRVASQCHLMCESCLAVGGCVPWNKMLQDGHARAGGRASAAIAQLDISAVFRTSEQQSCEPRWKCAGQNVCGKC